MSRAEIKAEWGIGTSTYRADFFRGWLEEKALNRDLGMRVSKALRAQINEELETAKRRAEAAERRAEGLAEVSTMLAKLGVPADQVSWRAVQRVREALGESPDALRREIAIARESLERVEKRLSAVAAEEVAP